MAKLTVTIDHTLGSAEAMKRIRAAADSQAAKASGYVKSVEWTESSAHVDGKGFSGHLRVGERDVTIDAELGFPASLMPVKVKKEAEAWLRGVLGN